MVTACSDKSTQMFYHETITCTLLVYFYLFLRKIIRAAEYHSHPFILQYLTFFDKSRLQKNDKAMLIDTHCHLLNKPLIDHIDSIMADCARLHIHHLVSSCFIEEIDQHLGLSARYPACHIAAGIHPLFIPDDPDAKLDLLRKACENRQLIAIGEIGLDFYHSKDNADLQIALFEAQLSIARHYQLPVILHLRKSVELATQILKKHKISRGVAHAFSGSFEQASQLIDLGFKIGLSGILTYPAAPKIQFMAKNLPDEAICLETDSPFLPPAWIKGKTNYPYELDQIAQYLAQLRQCPVDKVQQMTTKNAIAVFGFSTIHD